MLMLSTHAGGGCCSANKIAAMLFPHICNIVHHAIQGDVARGIPKQLQEALESTCTEVPALMPRETVWNCPLKHSCSGGA